MVFCFCASWKVKKVHLLFAEIKLLRHKPTLHDFGIVVLLFSPPKAPDEWHRDRSQLSRSVIGQIQVS